jgi:hypothetical protein
MSWVKEAIVQLNKGQEVSVRPSGGSMRGRIESGQRVTLKPALYDEVEAEDVIFIRWKGNYLLHLLLEKKDQQLLIGNNLGKINGWIPAGALIAKVIAIEA